MSVKKVMAQLAIVSAIGEAIRDLCAESPVLGGVPNGELYALLAGKLSLQSWNNAIAALKQAGLVEEKNFLLTWIGPAKKEGTSDKATEEAPGSSSAQQETGGEVLAANLSDNEGDSMTTNSIEDMEAGEPATETLPSEALAIEAPPEPRHLTAGPEFTLCGLARADVKACAHPSKAKKDDCPACREAARAKAKKDTACEFVAGDFIETPDGALWEVEDVRFGGMGVICRLGVGSNATGKKSTISRGSAVTAVPMHAAAARISEKSEAAKVEREEKAKETARAKAESLAVNAPPKPPAKERDTWKPSAADIAKVLELRVAGQSYQAIEKAMGWPDGHGNRPWRIIKGKVTARAEAPTA